jgi:hypothetical protein
MIQQGNITGLSNYKGAHNQHVREFKGFIYFKFILRSKHKKHFTQQQKNILDLKLSPWSECHMLSSGLLTSVCSLNANISEHSVCSIFTGGKVRNVTGVENVGYLHGKSSGSKNSLSQSEGG